MRWVVIIAILSILNLIVAFHGKFDLLNFLVGLFSGAFAILAFLAEMEFRNESHN